MEVLKGIPVAPGVRIGEAYVFVDAADYVPYQSITADAVDAELERFQLALDAVIYDVQLDRDRAAEHLGAEPAKIFEFHLGLLRDPALIDPIRQRISEQHVVAAYAATRAFHDLAGRFRSMGSQVFTEKANDIIDLQEAITGET